jgi:hypothetical protein
MNEDRSFITQPRVAAGRCGRRRLISTVRGFNRRGIAR